MRQPDEMRTVLKDRTVLATAAVGLTTLGLAGWFLFAGPSPDELDRTVYTHLHCSACQHEIPYRPSKVGKRCAMCIAGVYTPTAVSSRGGKGSWARVIAFVLLTAVAIQVTAYRVVVRRRQLRKEAEEERNQKWICRCPYCERKISYRSGRAGAATVCAMCKTAFLLPAFEEAEADPRTTHPFSTPDL